MSVTAQLDFKASASASQGQRGVELASSEDPGGAPPGLGTRVSDQVFIEADVGDGLV